VSVPTTVTDAKGRFVPGLTREDFRLYEDSQPQEITHFSSERVPVSLGIAIDSSGSMAGHKWDSAVSSVERLLDMVVRIGPNDTGGWEFLPGFDRMMGSLESYYAGATRPSTMPLLQWSQHALIPTVVFRNLRVPMLILDPQEPNDELDVTDQNEKLAAQHPTLIVHRIYKESGHAVVASRPDWFVRDATELLARVQKR
jgi:hypothetical protein